MDEAEKEHFRGMSKDRILERWESSEGENIRGKIIAINLEYGNSHSYESFVGTIKTGWGDEPPKIDLRGIYFSDYSNLVGNEIFGFDFSECALHYSHFSGVQFTSSVFRNADILYSEFSDAILDDCDFSGTNLNMTDFIHCRLENADFRNAWINEVSFEDSDLGYVKFNRRTDFMNIDLSKVRGSSNPLFVSFIRRKHYLKHFREQSWRNKTLYYVWLVISDCGQSLFRWSAVSILICALFGYVYSSFPSSFFLANDRSPDGFTFYYYSVVTFTTLGFGDIVPKDLWAEIAVTAQVILGYVMLGGLISIFATKFIPKD
ncbi:MAG: pentapeptide repeat-containing protein [Acidobacteriota bacterium]